MSRDLADAVTEVLQQRFGWWTANDSLGLMSDLAAAGVSLSMDDYVDISEHGLQIVFAHGHDCEGCKAVQRFAFDAVKGLQSDEA